MSYPGIYIDPQAFKQDEMRICSLNPAERGAFISATRQCLYRIASRPVGKDLLTLISKRCQGIGTSASNLKCRIMYSKGKRCSYIEWAAARTFGGAYVDVTLPENVFLQQFLKQFRIDRRVKGRAMTTAGKCISGIACFNPFINYDVVLDLPVPTPAFVSLAHELVHALHSLSGDWIWHDDHAKAKMIDEARAVGAGKYARTRISENAIRREHGLALRAYHTNPGDCAAAALS
jgi:hypothetical protein